MVSAAHLQSDSGNVGIHSISHSRYPKEKLKMFETDSLTFLKVFQNNLNICVTLFNNWNLKIQTSTIEDLSPFLPCKQENLKFIFTTGRKGLNKITAELNI